MSDQRPVDDHGPGRLQAAAREGLNLILSSRRARRVLYLFVALDVAFIGFHVLAAAARHAGLIQEDQAAWQQLFSIVNDYGLPEFWNQAKALLAAAVLYMTWTHTRQTVYLCWVLVFAVAGLDDAFRIHEQVGAALDHALVERFMEAPGSRRRSGPSAKPPGPRAAKRP